MPQPWAGGGEKNKTVQNTPSQKEIKKNPFFPPSQGENTPSQEKNLKKSTPCQKKKKKFQ
jgi:hypothetical protein